MVSARFHQPKWKFGYRETALPWLRRQGSPKLMVVVTATALSIAKNLAIRKTLQIKILKCAKIALRLVSVLTYGG